LMKFSYGKKSGGGGGGGGAGGRVGRVIEGKARTGSPFDIPSGNGKVEITAPRDYFSFLKNLLSRGRTTQRGAYLPTDPPMKNTATSGAR